MAMKLNKVPRYRQIVDQPALSAMGKGLRVAVAAQILAVQMVQSAEWEGVEMPSSTKLSPPPYFITHVVVT